MKKALFLTLDNTLITTLSGRAYSLHSEDWKFIIQTVEAIKDYYSKGYVICIITNQPQIANNIVSEKTFIRKMNLILKTLEKDLKIKSNEISYGYCIEEGTYHYLPNPGLIYDFALEFEIDVLNSILIGNSNKDKLIATYSGITTYIDKTNLTYII